MTFVVTENCIRCKYTDCVEACPVDAFHEGDDMLAINPDSCTDCGNCISVCPVEAIYDENDLPASFKKFIEQNRLACETWPVITTKKDPMPGAMTLEQLKNFREMAQR